MSHASRSFDLLSDNGKPPLVNTRPISPYTRARTKAPISFCKPHCTSTGRLRIAYSLLSLNKERSDVSVGKKSHLFVCVCTN